MTQYRFYYSATLRGSWHASFDSDEDAREMVEDDPEGIVQMGNDLDLDADSDDIEVQRYNEESGKWEDVVW